MTNGTSSPQDRPFSASPFRLRRSEPCLRKHSLFRSLEGGFLFGLQQRRPLLVFSFTWKPSAHQGLTPGRRVRKGSSVILCVWLSSGLSTISGSWGAFSPDCSPPAALEVLHHHKPVLAAHRSVSAPSTPPHQSVFHSPTALTDAAPQDTPTALGLEEGPPLLGLLGSALPFSGRVGSDVWICQNRRPTSGTFAS